MKYLRFCVRAFLIIVTLKLTLRAYDITDSVVEPIAVSSVKLLKHSFL